ncbi:hypothetical protein [Pseudolabrys sp. FHR47]|uniref:hypothetical protein n=1 Tax=Pseudolabrys sp. FHR47 TaxID=2562284 RepID=UPI0010BF55C1|nr:hypothetical protein [Pseudolabrys sp. FHR47]
MALIIGNEELARRLEMTERVLGVLFAYSLDYVAKDDEEHTIQMLGLRLFNAGATSVKLGLSGYYQTALQQARDIMETGFLIDYFRTSPDQIAVWRTADRKTRRKLFDPFQIRVALDERDGDKEMRRATEYAKLSELVSHATARGFQFTARGRYGELGPFIDDFMLKAWLHEVVLRLGPATMLYATHFPEAPKEIIDAYRRVGADLINGYKDA